MKNPSQGQISVSTDVYIEVDYQHMSEEKSLFFVLCIVEKGSNFADCTNIGRWRIGSVSFVVRTRSRGTRVGLCELHPFRNDFRSEMHLGIRPCISARKIEADIAAGIIAVAAIVAPGAVCFTV